MLSLFSTLLGMCLNSSSIPDVVHAFDLVSTVLLATNILLMQAPTLPRPLLFYILVKATTLRSSGDDRLSKVRQGPFGLSPANSDM